MSHPNLSADGTITFDAFIGRNYTFGFAGDFGGGSLAVNFVLDGVAAPFPNSPLNGPGTFTAVAPGSQIQLVLSGSTDPDIEFSIAPVNSETPAAIGAETPAGAAARSITEARRRRPLLPQVSGRLAELFEADKTINIYCTGDSMSGKISTDLQRRVNNSIGIVGWAFEFTGIQNLAGSVSNLTQDSTETSKNQFWETGRITVLSTGASVAIGRLKSNLIDDAPINKFTLYLGRNIGNGTATVSVSYDGGATWEADIETVDTSHTEVGVLVKSYTLAATRLTRIRVVAASGPVQIIAAKLWDSTRAGAIMGMSGRPGASLSQYSSYSTQAIRNTVMADFAPHLVTGQLSESVEEMAALPTWLNIWMEACPSADFLFTNIYDILNRDKPTYTDVVNAAYDSAVAAYPRFFVHDISASFKNKEYLNTVGFHPLDAADVHLTDRDGLAWKAVSLEISNFLGFDNQPVTPKAKRISAGEVEADYTSPEFGTVNIATVSEISPNTSTFTKIWKFFTPTGLASWRIRRRSSTDAVAPYALDFRCDLPGASILTWGLIGGDGTVKFGTINTGSTTTAGADGYRASFVAGLNSQKAARFSVSSLNTQNCVDFGRGTDIMAAVDRRFQFQSATGFAHGATGAGPKWLAGAVAPSGTAATMTIASPGIITVTGHGFANGMAVSFATDGALPTGITAGTSYFVKNATANTFEVAVTPTATSITTSGSQSGSHTVSAVATDGSIYCRSGGGGAMYLMVSGTWVEK
jgi:hypothetical protein